MHWERREGCRVHHGMVGHLFEGRFKRVVLEAESYLLELSRYLHLNPVRGETLGERQKICAKRPLSIAILDALSGASFFLVNFRLFGSSRFHMPSHSEAVKRLFQAHQKRLAAIAAVPGAAALSNSLRAASATGLAKEIQALLKSQYTSDCAAGTTAEEKLAILATSAAELAKQMRPLAPDDAFYQAFTTGSVSAAQEVFMSIFGPPSKGKVKTKPSSP